MAAISNSSPQPELQTQPSLIHTHPATWHGQDVEVLHSQEERSSTPDPRISKLRQIAIEIGRWASYVFSWFVPAAVYLGGVALAAFISPTTAIASVPAFIAACYATHNHAIPAIRSHFNRLQTT